MAKFYSLKVKEVRRETKEAVSLNLEVPLNLIPEYKFIQGQYLTLKLNINGEEQRRSYSICSSPYDQKELRIAIKEVDGGKVSTYINRELKEGTQLEVMTPMGNFHTPLSGSNKKHYVLFAGGSGITPMMSIIKSVLYIEKQSRITLIYANRNEDSVIFKQELEALISANDRLKVLFIYDQPAAEYNAIQKGMIDDLKVKSLFENYIGHSEENVYFICGPGPMMEVIKNSLAELKVPSEKIHIEYFSAVLDTLAKEEVSDSNKVISKITVMQYGMSSEITLKTDGPSILDAALEAGIDVPFSCKGAVCCTCRAKVLEGKVKMDANFALTDNEVAEGFILTCQSHPLTEKLVIDYDAV